MSKTYKFNVKTIDGEQQAIETYAGKVILVVNVASKCGFTSQYEGLEALYQKYKEQGLTILGFPCNQFGAQEPGSESEIKEFCSLTYNVTFPMFSKVDVNGDNTDPFYAHLKENAKGLLGTEAVKWNFTKFLIDRDGNIVDRFAPNTKPSDLEKDIENLL